MLSTFRILFLHATKLISHLKSPKNAIIRACVEAHLASNYSRCHAGTGSAIHAGSQTQILCMHGFHIYNIDVQYLKHSNQNHKLKPFDRCLASKNAKKCHNVMLSWWHLVRLSTSPEWVDWDDTYTEAIQPKALKSLVMHHSTRIRTAWQDGDPTVAWPGHMYTLSSVT